MVLSLQEERQPLGDCVVGINFLDTKLVSKDITLISSPHLKEAHVTKDIFFGIS